MTVITLGDRGALVSSSLADAGTGWAPGDLFRVPGNGDCVGVVDEVTEQVAIISANDVAGEIVLTGDVTSTYLTGVYFRVFGSSNNDQTYLIDTAVFGGGNTTVTVVSPGVAAAGAGGFATLGAIESYHIGFAGTDAPLGESALAYLESEQSVQYSLSFNAAARSLVLGDGGDWTGLYVPGTEVVITGLDPATGYTVESSTYDNGFTTIVMEEAFGDEESSQLLIHVVNYFSGNPEPESGALDITAIKPGDGTVRVLVEYQIIDV